MRVLSPRFVVHTTTTSEAPDAFGTSAMRGGVSLLMRASPATWLTCTGALKLRPPSRLVTAYTSVALDDDADRATPTKSPRAAIDGLALARPSTWKLTCL